MSNLSKEQKELILDFYFRCGSQQDIDRGRELIAVNHEASNLYAKLEGTLTQLDSIKHEPCPENLTEITIARLKLAASTGHTTLGELLAAEQQKTSWKYSPVATTKRSFWRNIMEVAAVAAAVILVTGIGFPALSTMRQKHWQTVCAANLNNVGRGLALYAQDYDGRLPSVASAAGAPWWQIGSQSSENHSNTRNPWLLVRTGYVRGEDFICPGHIGARPVHYDQTLMGGYSDFPSRQNVSFSFKFLCDKSRTNSSGKAIIIMADLNPVFVKLPYGASYKLDEFARLWINEQLKNISSPNHRGRGQNILQYDGSVDFTIARIINNDDIFTIQNVSCYSGREVPCDQNDVFLAP